MDQEASATQGKHDDENDDESSVSSASSSSYERNRRRRKKHKKRKRYDSDEEEARRRKKRKKHRRRSSSSSSSSESSRRKKRKRKHKKKHKKKKRQEESDRESDDGASQFGKYGIIKAADFNRMQRSFSIWLAEVKGIPSLSSRYEQQKYFTDFCEDYNTATLPHKKYYDYEKWEMQEYEKQKLQEAKMSVSGNTVLADEARHKREQQERARARQEAERRALYGSMSREKVEEMKHQAKLRSQMQMAYKTGDKATYERLKERLEADE